MKFILTRRSGHVAIRYAWAGSLSHRAGIRIGQVILLIATVRNTIDKMAGGKFILDADIRKCFETIDHTKGRFQSCATEMEKNEMRIQRLCSDYWVA